MPNPPTAPPLILTLLLDAAATRWFDALRTAHFPPERLLVGAHVTLFHALPGEAEREIVAAVAERAANTAPFAVAVQGLRSLGRGVAFALASEDAQCLRARLAARFASRLTPQDRARWRPHVTVQNKVAPDTARRTLAAVAALPPPASIRAEAIAVWRYCGGPWQPVAELRFAPQPCATTEHPYDS